MDGATDGCGAERSLRPMLSLDGVGVAYRRRAGWLRRSAFWALRDVSVQVFRGETLGVVGRNGSGKSTLMRVLARIIEPDRGCREGEVSAALLSLRLGFAPYLTGRQNAQLSGLLQGMRRARVRERMDAIVAFADVGEAIDQPISTWSSGMVARLAFAVAVQAEPDVLLVDEVWGVGDEEFRVKSRTVMRDMVSSRRTVVLATHNLDLVRRFCDRAIWLEDGRLRAQGAPEEVVEAYRAAAGGGSA